MARSAARGVALGAMTVALLAAPSAGAAKDASGERSAERPTGGARRRARASSGAPLRAEGQLLVANAGVRSGPRDEAPCGGTTFGGGGTLLWHPARWFGMGVGLWGMVTATECGTDPTLGVPLSLRLALPLDAAGQELHLLGEVGLAGSWPSDAPSSPGDLFSLGLGYRSRPIVGGAHVAVDIGATAIGVLDGQRDYWCGQYPFLRLGASWDL